MNMKDNTITYIEFKAMDIAAIKKFYSLCFGWEFKDYGPDYTAFKESGVFGGFEKSESKIQNGALVVLYHSDLEKIKSRVLENGATISKEIFEFPGGRRFHFIDPSGNELAVWSDK